MFLNNFHTDYHCKIKETLLIQELKPAFNVNVSSEKLMLYLLAVAVYRFTFKIVFLILVPHPLSLLYKRFVKIVTVTFENVCWLAYETSSLYKNA